MPIEEHPTTDSALDQPIEAIPPESLVGGPEDAETTLPEVSASGGGYMLMTLDTSNNSALFIAVFNAMETAVDAAENHDAKDGEVVVIVPAVYSRMG